MHTWTATHTQTLILNKRYRSLLTSAIILQLFVLDGAICKKSWKTSSSVTRRSKFPTYLSIKVQIIYDKYGIKKQPQSQTKLTTEIASHAYRIAIQYRCMHVHTQATGTALNGTESSVNFTHNVLGWASSSHI